MEAGVDASERARGTHRLDKARLVDLVQDVAGVEELPNADHEQDEPGWSAGQRYRDQRQNLQEEGQRQRRADPEAPRDWLDQDSADECAHPTDREEQPD